MFVTCVSRYRHHYGGVIGISAVPVMREFQNFAFPERQNIDATFRRTKTENRIRMNAAPHSILPPGVVCLTSDSVTKIMAASIASFSAHPNQLCGIESLLSSQPVRFSERGNDGVNCCRRALAPADAVGWQCSSSSAVQTRQYSSILPCRKNSSFLFTKSLGHHRRGPAATTCGIKVIHECDFKSS